MFKLGFFVDSRQLDLFLIQLQFLSFNWFISVMHVWSDYWYLLYLVLFYSLFLPSLALIDYFIWFHILFFLSVSISLFLLPIWFCTLSIIFSTRTFHILILAVLNSQPDKSKISDTSASGSNACFVSLEWVFSNFKHALQFSCLKPDKVYQVIGTEINWHLLWGFMFIF